MAFVFINNQYYLNLFSVSLNNYTGIYSLQGYFCLQNKCI